MNIENVLKCHGIGSGLKKGLKILPSKISDLNVNSVWNIADTFSNYICSMVMDTNGDVYFFEDNKLFIYKISSIDGSTLATIDTSANTGGSLQDIAIDKDNNVLYAIYSNGYVYKFNVDGSYTGYKNSVNGYGTNVTYHNNKVFTVDDYCIITCFDANLNVLWGYDAMADSSYFGSGLSVHDTHVCGLSSDGSWKIFDVSSQVLTGSGTETNLKTCVALHDNTGFIILTRDGLKRVDNTGSQQWNVTGSNFESLDIDIHDNVYVGGVNGIYRIFSKNGGVKYANDDLMSGSNYINTTVVTDKEEIIIGTKLSNDIAKFEQYFEIL